MAEIKPRQNTNSQAVRLSEIDLTNVFGKAATNFQNDIQNLQNFLKEMPVIGEMIEAWKGGADFNKLGEIFTHSLSEGMQKLGIDNLTSPSAPQSKSASAPQTSSPVPIIEP